MGKNYDNDEMEIDLLELFYVLKSKILAILGVGLLFGCIACGNGNYSSYLAQRGASVVAFDYSKKMIELAKRRQSQYAKQIEF